MSQSINANLKATITVDTDFKNAYRDINRLTKFITQQSMIWNQRLNQGLTIKKTKIQMPQPASQAMPYEPSPYIPRIQIPRPPSNITKIIKEIKEKTGQEEFRTTRTPGGIRIREKGKFVSEEAVKERWRELYQPRTPPSVTPVQSTRGKSGEVNINVKVEVSGGGASNIVTDIADTIRRNNEVKNAILTLVRGG
nr:MAG: hypothetical protein [Lokiarchaeota virus Ratatoskr Meg22_1012]